MVDNLRPALGAYGDAAAVTPEMDALAAAPTATLFADAQCQVAWCAPSRNSFLSGRRPAETRALNFLDSFREAGPAWTTLPGYFLQHGFYTTSVGKVFHPNLPADGDFPLSWSDAPFAPEKRPCPGGTMFCALAPGGADADAAAADEALARLAGRPRDRPFFLALGLQAPRLPWVFDPAQAARLPPEPEIPIARNGSADGLAPLEYFRPTEVDQYADVRNVTHDAPMPAAQQRAARRAYLATVAGADAQLGRVLAALEAQGLANSTVVALVADHGQALGERNLWSMMSLLDAATRVPFIVRLPAAAPAAVPATAPAAAPPAAPSSPASVYEGPVELVDLFPTLASLAGLPAPPAAWALPGTDLSPVFAGLPVAKDAAFSQISRCRNCSLAYANESAQCAWDAAADAARFAVPCALAPRADFDFMGLSVRTREWRLSAFCVWNGAALAPDMANCSSVELFDHRADFAPGAPLFDAEAELDNLADDPAYADVRAQLWARLEQQFGGGGGGRVDGAASARPATSAAPAAAAAGGVLVGISAASPPSLVHLSPTTGKVIFTGPPLADELVAQQLAALDAARGVFYALGYDDKLRRTNLISLNASTGAVLSSVAVPRLFEPALVGVGQALAVEPASGRLVALGRRSAGAPHEVGLLDPRTGNFSTLHNLTKAFGDSGSCVCAFDARRNRVLAGVASAGIEELVLIDLAPGGGVTPVPESFGDGDNLQALSYDAALDAFVGLGISPDTMFRTVVRLDAAALKWAVVGNVSGFLVMMGPISALDADAGVVYWMGAQGQTTGPFFLVGVSAATAEVVSASSAPVAAPEPWSLLWLPAPKVGPTATAAPPQEVYFNVTAPGAWFVRVPVPFVPNATLGGRMNAWTAMLTTQNATPTPLIFNYAVVPPLYNRSAEVFVNGIGYPGAPGVNPLPCEILGRAGGREGAAYCWDVALNNVTRNGTGIADMLLRAGDEVEWRFDCFGKCPS